MVVTCPHCKRKLKLPEGSVPKRVRCASCQQVFAIATRKPSAPPAGPAAQPAAAPEPAADDLELRFEEPEPAAAPAAGPAAAPGAGPAAAAPDPFAHLQPPPPEEPKRRSMAPLIKGLVAVVVAVAVLFAAWTFVLKGMLAGGLGENAAYVPENAKVLARFDAAKLRKSALYQQIASDVEAAEKELREEMKGLKLGFGDIREVFLASAGAEQPVVVVHTMKDVGMTDLVADPKMVVRGTLEGFEFLQLRAGADQGVIVRTGPHTLCIAQSQEAATPTLQRVRKNEKGQLSDALKAMLGRVGGHDHYVAAADVGSALKGKGMPPLPIPGLQTFAQIQAVGVGFSVGKAIDIEVFLSFPDEDKAKTCKAQVDGIVATVVQQIEPGLARLQGDEKEMAERALAVLKALEVAQDGSVVKLAAQVDEATTKSLASALRSQIQAGRTEARRIRNRNNLNQIAKACYTYLNEHGDNRFYPKSLGDLVDKGVLTDKGVLVSPLDDAPPKLPNGVPCSYESCFDKYPDRQFRDDFPPNVAMAWDRKAFALGQRSVLFFDSHVESVSEAHFAQLLKQLDAQVKRLAKPR